MYVLKLRVLLPGNDKGFKRKQKTLKSLDACESWLKEQLNLYSIDMGKLEIEDKATGQILKVTCNKHGKLTLNPEANVAKRKKSAMYTVTEAQTTLLTLLQKYGFYYELEDINSARCNGYLDLVKKTYGDSYADIAISVFGADYTYLEAACHKLGITMTKDSPVDYD